MAGILDYKRYLNTLQTINDIDNVFPNEQTNYTFSVNRSGAQGWTADIAWTTLLIDKVEWDRENKPVLTNSQIIGYFPTMSGTASQAGTGLINFPANMYTGPILPQADVYVPVTIVNVTWTKSGSNTYTENIALIQNWKPGVNPNSPYDYVDFYPIDPVASVLTLTGDDLVIYEDDFYLTAVSDIPIPLGDANPCNFYVLEDGGRRLLGTTYFVDHIAHIVLNSFGLIGIGNWEIVAEFNGRHEYGKTTSNTWSLEVVEGIPLLVDEETFTPSKDPYFPGDHIDYHLKLVQSPDFAPTGVPISNTATVNIRNEFPPASPVEIFNGNFYNGELDTAFTVDASMIDIGITSSTTDYTILDYTLSGGNYIPRIQVTNQERITTAWQRQRIGKYARGSHNVDVNVANTTTRVIPINTFTLSISQSNTSSLLEEPFTITVDTTSSGYTQDIFITASPLGSTDTNILYYGNHSGQGEFDAEVSLLSTGTWTIVATYAGDFGQSIYWGNDHSSSNVLTHTVRRGNDLNARFIFNRTTNTDVLTVWGFTSTNLINTVTFLTSSTVVGSTATWTRDYIGTPTISVLVQGGSIESAFPSVNFKSTNTSISLMDSTGSPGNLSSNQTDVRQIFGYWDTTSRTRVGAQLPGYVNTPKITQYYSASGQGYGYPTWPYDVDQGYLTANRGGQTNPNRYRLFKYYDGTNYNLSAVTGTNIDGILDPITTGTWNVTFIESQPSASIWGQGVEMNEYLSDYPAASSGATYPSGYQFDFYDIYRDDDIGDTRGYNVVALHATDAMPRPEVSVANPRRVFFNAPKFAGVSTATFHIDLVEYIGTAQWVKPIQNNAQAAGTEARETVTAWLYRFTPEVRQTNFTFRNHKPLAEQIARLPANEYQYDARAIGNSWYKKIPVIRNNNIFRDKHGDIKVARYQAIDADDSYGIKTWYSRNPNDPVENEYTAFCNAFFNTFAYNSTQGTVSPPVVETLYTSTNAEYVDLNRSFARIELPLNTIESTATLHATWPGTRYLGAQYGKFNDFDIYAELPVAQISLGAYNVATSGIHTTATVVYSTNPVNLEALLVPSDLGYKVQYNDVTLYDSDSNTDLLTEAVVGSTATFVVIANDLTSSVNAPFLNLRARADQASHSNILRLQAVRSPYTSGLTYTDNLTEWATLLEKTFATPKRTNNVRVDGTLNIVMPFFDRALAGSLESHRVTIAIDFKSTAGQETWNTGFRLTDKWWFATRLSGQTTPVSLTASVTTAQAAFPSFAFNNDVYAYRLRVQVLAYGGSNSDYPDTNTGVKNLTRAFYTTNFEDRTP